MTSEFKPLKWPSGRACKSTTNGHCYKAVVYKGQCGNFPTEFHRFLSKLTKTAFIMPFISTVLGWAVTNERN